jgi:haloalkane dehalogenase
MKTTTIKTLFFVFVILFFPNLKAQEIYSGKATKVEKDISADFPFESKFLTLGADTVIA